MKSSTKFLATIVLSVTSTSLGITHFDEDESPLHQEMEVIRDSMKNLRQSLREEAQNASSLESIQALQHALVNSKMHQPPMIKSAPEGDRENLSAAFRKEINNTIRVTLDLEDAILDKKQDDIRGIFKKLRDMESKGHDKFNPDE